MLSINIFDDEELQKVLDIFISSLLPHKNFEDTLFNDVLQHVFKYIRLDEMHMEYYVMFKVLSDLGRIKMISKDFVPKLEKSIFGNTLESSIGDSILSPEVGIAEWLEYEHLESNLQIETVKADACQKLYSRCIELYDRCFLMEQSTVNVINYVPSLKAAFLAHVSNQALISQAKIIQGSLRVGRKEYTGAAGWLDFTITTTSEVNRRISDADDNDIMCVDSVDKASTLLNSLKDRFIPIAKYGIPEIDGESEFEGTPILRHRLVVVVGNENIGKSMFGKDTATNIMLAGGRVVYMCGENVKSLMYCEILVNYIYKKYNYFVLPSHINDLENCPEHIRKIINLAMVEIAESKSLILRDSYSYDSLYSELVSDYEKYHADAFIIDHSFALTGGKDGDNGKSNIDGLAKDAREFRKNYPVYCLVLSHPSTPAKDSLAKDKAIEYSSTKGSQNLSTDADDLFVLRDNEVLRKEGMIAIENIKRRNASRITERIILKKMFSVSHFDYDEKYQATATSLSVDADIALNRLESMYSQDDYTL